MMEEASRQARCLSSGTIATLIKQPEYQVIDKVQAAFVAFTEAHPEHKRWQDAWEKFSAMGGVATVVRGRLTPEAYSRLPADQKAASFTAIAVKDGSDRAHWYFSSTVNPMWARQALQDEFGCECVIDIVCGNA